MKITILQGAFLPVPPLRGGAVEKMWFRLGQEFAARGHEVVHYSRRCDGLAERESIGGVQHRRLRGYDRPSATTLNQLRDFQYSHRVVRMLPDADIVITNSFWSPLLLRPRHGAQYVDVQRMPRGQLRWYRHAARFRANSSAVADAIAAQAPRLAERTRVIPNPLPFDAAPAVNWTAKQRTILFAGRLHPEKGIELLLQSWRSLRARGGLRDWSLLLIGPHAVSAGGGGDEWWRELRERYRDDAISWLQPEFDDVALARVYGSATVFVYPSLAESGETFGSAVLEAMAWGAVPVVSDLACFRDFVVPGTNGFIFNHRGPGAADALAAALETATRTASVEMARAAVAVRESHAPGTIAEAFLRDFAELA